MQPISAPANQHQAPKEAMQSLRPSENGAPQEQWSAEHYAANCRFVADLAMQPLLDLLAPKAGERILDLGCGDGELN